MNAIPEGQEVSCLFVSFLDLAVAIPLEIRYFEQRNVAAPAFRAGAFSIATRRISKK